MADPLDTTQVRVLAGEARRSFRYLGPQHTGAYALPGRGRVVIGRGGDADLHINERTVSSELADEIREKRFRPDLYYRLNSIVARIPPLRERPEEIKPLAAAFAVQTSTTLNRTPPRVPADMVEVLRGYDWPGNVRELRNAIERAVLL